MVRQSKEAWDHHNDPFTQAMLYIFGKEISKRGQKGKSGWILSLFACEVHTSPDQNKFLHNHKIPNLWISILTVMLYINRGNFRNIKNQSSTGIEKS